MFPPITYFHYSRRFRFRCRDPFSSGLHHYVSSVDSLFKIGRDPNNRSDRRTLISIRSRSEKRECINRPRRDKTFPWRKETCGQLETIGIYVDGTMSRIHTSGQN
jgi:hypothetical protein